MIQTRITNIDQTLKELTYVAWLQYYQLSLRLGCKRFGKFDFGQFFQISSIIAIAYTY